jgi:RNA polymerase-binding transcription factor DksA
VLVASEIGWRDAVLARRDEALAMIDSLTRRHDEIVESSRFEANDDEHDPEGATVAFERAQVAALRRQARDDLEALDAALTRIDDGTYGQCGKCGKPIGEGRLEALPAATTCVTCAT